MIKVRRSLKDFSIVLSGNIISKIFAVLMSIIIARTLGPDRFGTFTIAFSVMTILASGLSGIDYTYVHGYIKKINSVSFSHYLFFKLSVVLILIILGMIFSPLICTRFFNNSISPFGLGIGLVSALGFILYRLIYVFYQAREEFNRFASVQIFYYFIVFLGVVILNLMKIKIYFYYLFPYLITGVFMFVIFFLFIKNVSYQLNNFSFLKFFNIGKWIILSEIFIVFLAKLDFLIVSHHISGKLLGYYSVAMRVVNIYLAFTAAFSTILLPKANSIRNDKHKRNFYKTSALLFIILTITNLTLVLLSRFIVLSLFGKEYLGSIKIAEFLLLAYLPFTFYQPFRYLSYTYNKTFLLFIVPFLQSLFLLLFGGLFINRIGIYGIIITKMLTFLLGLIVFPLSTIKGELPDENK